MMMKYFYLVLPLVLLCACDWMKSDEVIHVSGKGIRKGDSIGHVEIFDQEALKYLNKNDKLSVRADGFTWVEGPLWVDDGEYLLFSEIPKNLVRKFDPSTGDVSIYLANGGYTVTAPGQHGSNGLLLNQQKQLVLMQQGDRRVSVMDAPLSLPKDVYSPLITEYRGKRLNSPNDGVFDSKGYLYFTDPTYSLNGNDRKQELAFQGVFRLSESGEIEVLDKLTFPNGIGLSPDGKSLYVAVSDPEDAVWYAYDINDQGGVKNKRRFYDANDFAGQKGHSGLPDGMVVHSSGVIFATGPGGVWLFSPKGKLLAKIMTGQNTSNCALTTNEDMLYITADDYLMSIPIKPS